MNTNFYDGMIKNIHNMLNKKDWTHIIKITNEYENDNIITSHILAKKKETDDYDDYIFAISIFLEKKDMFQTHTSLFTCMGISPIDLKEWFKTGKSIPNDAKIGLIDSTLFEQYTNMSKQEIGDEVTSFNAIAISQGIENLLVATEDELKKVDKDILRAIININNNTSKTISNDN